MSSCASTSVVGKPTTPRNLRAAQALLAKLATSPAPIAAAVRRQITTELRTFETSLELARVDRATAEWQASAASVRRAAGLN